MDAPVTFRSEQRLTQDEFFDWLEERPPHDIHHYELIQGRIIMTPPANFHHGSLGARLVFKLSQHVEPRRLGQVQDSSTGYDLPSGDTLEPDVSFVSRQRLEAEPPRRRSGFGRMVPDLVVEILSPSTSRRDRTTKRDIYARNGVREYWLVDPRRRTVTVLHLRGDAFDRGEAQTTGPLRSELFPDLELTPEDIFNV